MKARKNHTRFLCGSLAAAAAVSPILSITAWADNISTANFNLRQQVVKLTGIMEISSFRENVSRADFAKMLVKASSYRENLPTSNVSVYADVPATDPNAVYPHCSKRRLDERIFRRKIQTRGSGTLQRCSESSSYYVRLYG